MTLEDRLAGFLKQPGTFITRAEQQFINDMRNAAVDGVGYGWMQQVIEWEWQSKGRPGSWGPEYSAKQGAGIERLQAALREIVELVPDWSTGVNTEAIARARAALSGKGEP